MYAVYGFGLLRFVFYHHYTISMLVYCTAMYKLCDCWKKNINKSSFRRNQLCRINCICFFARPQEQTNWKVEWALLKRAITPNQPQSPPVSPNHPQSPKIFSQSPTTTHNHLQSPRTYSKPPKCTQINTN